jgi:hypothetical protein
MCNPEPSASQNNTNRAGSGSSSSHISIDLNEYQELLEIKVWEKIKNRVWGLIGSVLVIISILGYLGLSSYIDGKISKATEKAQVEFKKSTERSLFFAKNLALLNAQYTVALNEFRKDITYLLRVSKGRNWDAYQMSKAQGSPVTAHDVLSIQLKMLLRQLVVRDDFAPIFAQKIDLMKMLDGKEHSPFTESKDVIIEIYKSNGSSYQLSAHPILNGSLGGSILDLKYRIMVLHAFKSTYKEFESEFLSGKSDISIPFYGAADFYKQYLKERYKSNIDKISSSYLSDSELKTFNKYFDLYNIDYFGV